LDAAQSVFVRAGFEAATIEEIAERAGYTRGAFYFNFKSKEELLIAAVTRVLGRLSHNIDELSQKYVDPQERLAGLQQFYARLSTEDFSSALLFIEYKLFAVRHPKRHAKLAAAYAKVRQSRERLLEKSANELGLKLPVSANLLETAFAALLTGLLLDRAFYLPGYQPAAAEVETIINLFFERIVSYKNGS
jgi:AcrR family transcriptional regulator